MPKLSKIAPKRTCPVAVVLEGETVTLDVALYQITSAMISQMQKQSKKDEFAALIGFLTTTIVGWDVEGEKGEPLPVSAEILQTLPVAVLGAFAQGVMDAVTSGNAETSPA